MSLLAALLGMSGGTSGDGAVGGLLSVLERATTDEDEADAPYAGTRASPRLAGGARRILRRTNHAGRTASSRGGARAGAARLTEADVRVSDPGSVEPVRQGLMTLHTLLGNALFHSERATQHDPGEEKTDDVNESNVSNTPRRPFLATPLESYRQWYRGQWIDVLDTVNQWLEATIVDIVSPSDILPHYFLGDEVAYSPRPNANRRKHRRRTPDAVVSAHDLEGRRRLLLEPRPEDGEKDEGSVYDLLDEGYRPRDDNDGVQLLLVHYNGWPHRWDEWIRSDSERIRPFRTRTRHRSTVSDPFPDEHVP